MFSKSLIAAALVLVVPAIAHAEPKPDPKPEPTKKHVTPSPPKPPPKVVAQAPKTQAPKTPKKVAAADPKGAAPRKVASTDPKGATPKKSTPVAAPPRKPAPPKPPCLKAPVEVTTGVETSKFSLAMCDGSPAALAVEHLSIIARGGAPKPAEPIADLAKVPGANIARGIRRFDPGLIVRLQRAVDRFAKAGEPPKILIVSGYRPASTGSYHASARALDFRLEGVKNEELVAFCKTLDDTGCGYYPNSSFVHMDVREGAGHVSWIDTSGPGETPRYVTTWPPPKAPPLALPIIPHTPRALGPATHTPAIDPDDAPAAAIGDDF